MLFLCLFIYLQSPLEESPEFHTTNCTRERRFKKKKRSAEFSGERCSRRGREAVGTTMSQHGGSAERREAVWHRTEEGGFHSCCRSEAHLVVAHVINRVVRPEEDVTKDPQGLPILGWQVSGPNANHAATICALLGGNNAKLMHFRAVAPIRAQTIQHSRTKIAACLNPQS